MSSKTKPETADGFLKGVRVLEIGDEQGEYCGKLLAGLGADVIKIEPPQGEITRTYGPFYEDTPGVERSLYFWHYNFGKRGIVLDLDITADQERFRQLAATAAVVLDARPKDYLSARDLGYDALKKINPGLIVSRISPFGDDGPWSGYKGSDIVHLALGGVMKNCGYDADPSGFYETPPIAPQMWHSYHIVGEMAAMAIMGALYHRAETGEGQCLSATVHGAVAQQTEGDMPSWIFLRQVHKRVTCRHSRPLPDPMILAPTKDGRYLFPYLSYASTDTNAVQSTIKAMAKHGMAEDLLDEKYTDPKYVGQKPVQLHISGVINRFVQKFMFDREIWRELQAAGQTWAPVRKPEENTTDEHWRARETFFDVYRPELGKTFAEVGAKWMCTEVPWRRGPRSPLLGEHTEEVFKTLAPTGAEGVPSRTKAKTNKRALDGVKFIDLGWLVASAGAGRFIAALGAEVVKVEHKSRWDAMRMVNCIVAPDGKALRDAATGPLPDVKPTSPNRAGFFADINAGKRSISLNLKNPRGKEILTKLLEIGDVVAEGYSPGTMDRMGFGYERLKQINPRLVYVQQSGMGQIGLYGQMRSYGPVAQAFSGVSEMSGLQEPYPPAGIGYSFLDWFGAYNLANGILAGLYRQKMTGKGCWIDSSQVECGTYLNGTSILDFSANGKRWSRYGNRSPYKVASPNGAFRAKGDDQWVAVSCFTEDEWQDLARVLGNPAWSRDSKFATLKDRLAHQDELETLMNKATAGFDPYELQEKLQRASVPAGVCQSAQDRCEHDAQLTHLNWLVNLKQSEIGVWPAKNFPVRMSGTPASIGDPFNRHGPNYGEDNEYIYGEWLGFSTAKIRELEQEDVI
jgi:crotonobetainyl-CoA:carnitine CoA-transferase CaiB-like acyl-CoA transferase